jgi:hypothetical protein
MTVGFHAPLPPTRSGVADYAAALLAALREFGTVQVDPARADVRLYHLGNNQAHNAIHARSLADPGITVLHDAVLHHFYLGGLDGPSYRREFVYNYGEWNGELAERLWSNRARSSIDPIYFQYGMLRRVAEHARAVVVHNPGAAAMVRAHAPTAEVVEIPHLFAPPASLPGPDEVAAFRDALGIPRRALLAGVLGHLREPKRVLPVVRTVTAMHARGAPVYLLLAGAFASIDLQRAVAPWLASPAIRRLDYLDEAAFWCAAASLDAGISLRFPAAGETSGITIRLMGLAKPVLVTAGPETSRFPAGTCLPIDHGFTECELIEHYLAWLTAAPAAGRELGCRAARHIAAFHNPTTVARQFWALLSRYAALPQNRAPQVTVI